MNLPNQLTVARFFLTLLFVAVLSVDWRYAHTAGLALFVLASLTDYADGEIARRWQMETNFGRLMDPLADKVLLAAAFICLAAEREFPAWVAIVIISREFLITGLRLLAASQGIVLAADNAGKHKTIWQIVTVIFFLLFGTLKEVWSAGSPWYPPETQWLQATWRFGGIALVVLALILTLYSGLSYLWKNRALIRGY